MTRKDIPNVISMLRIMLVFPIVVTLVAERFVEALTLFFIAGASDGLDGYLAKHHGWASRLGTIIDPIADKLLLVTTILTLGWLHLLPLWLVVMVLARDIIIFSGAVAYHFLVGKYEMAPSLTSKLNTVVQIMLVLTTIFSHGIYSIAPWVTQGLMYSVLVTTILSGTGYAWVWGNRAWRQYRKTLHD